MIDLNTVMIFKMLAALLAVLALLGILIVCMRYLQSKKGLLTGVTDRVRIQQQVHLGGKNRLYVIQWKDHDYLVGLSQNACTLFDKTLTTSPLSYQKHTSRSPMKDTRL